MRPLITLTFGSTASPEFRALVSFPLPAPVASEALNHLVRLAARIVKAEGSFLLLNCGDTLTTIQTFGVTGISDHPSWDLLASFGLSLETDLRAVSAVHPAEDSGFLVTVPIRRDGLFLGVLGMHNPQPAAFIPAQEYVVQAIAFEIAEHLEAEHRSGIAGTTSEISIDLFARLRLLESVVINANDSILITEAEPVELPGPRILYANPAFTRTTGYSLEDVLGKSPRLLQGPLTAPEAPARIHAALKAWEPVEVELLNYRKDGTTFWVELSISPVCDEKGWYTHWVSVQRDMTERNALNTPPTSPLTRPRILLAGDDAGMRQYLVEILHHDYQLDVAATTAEAAEATLKFLPDLVLVDRTDPLMDGAALVHAFRKNIATQRLPIILLTAEADDESQTPSSEDDPDDTLTKPFGSREIRARVRTQLELQILKRDNAAKENFIRTMEALRQSEKLALVGRLASSIAHEINNPLEAIGNLLYLAEGSLGDSEAGNYVKLAQAELARAANIATQTLRFHRQTAEAQPTSIHEVLDGMLILFQARPGSAELSIERQYRTRRPIMAFESDLRQVFANLVGNAMDASAPGGKIVLRVREACHPVTREAGIRVLIADNGQGMSEETRQRIYDPFFTTKGMAGTGLGLWVSSEILRNHKASVRVRSNQTPAHHGTVFSIFFPLQ